MENNTLNGINPERLFEAIQDGAQVYRDEADWFCGSDVVDVFIVGSAIREDFTPGESDVDVCITVDGLDETGVVGGLDTFFREAYQSQLQNAVRPFISHVDIGVYTHDSVREFIDDETVFSCRNDCFVTL